MAACRRVIRHLWLMLALIPLPAWGGAEGAAFIYVTNRPGTLGLPQETSI